MKISLQVLYAVLCVLPLSFSFAQTTDSEALNLPGTTTEAVATETSTEKIKDKKEKEVSYENLSKQAFSAAEAGNFEELEAAFNPRLFYTHNEEGETIFTQAIKAGNVELVEFLEPHAVINIKNTEGETPLTLAIKSGNTEIIELVTQRAKAGLKNEAGEAPLFLAIQHFDRLDFLKELIEKGADVNRMSNGLTPLSKAVEMGKLPIVALFIKNGANPSKANADGSIPLYIAVQNGQEQIAGMLLYTSKDLEADANWETHLGQPILLIATDLGQTGIVNSLLQYGADPNGTDYMDNTALSLAATKGNAVIMQALLESGSDVNHQNMLGVTPVLAAAEAGQFAAANYLADNGADIGLESVTGFAATDFYGFAPSSTTGAQVRP